MAGGLLSQARSSFCRRARAVAGELEAFFPCINALHSINALHRVYQSMRHSSQRSGDEGPSSPGHALTILHSICSVAECCKEKRHGLAVRPHMATYGLIPPFLFMGIFPAPCPQLQNQSKTPTQDFPPPVTEPSPSNSEPNSGLIVEPILAPSMALKVIQKNKNTGPSFRQVLNQSWPHFGIQNSPS